MDWQRLLSPQRLCTDEVLAPEAHRSAFEKDMDRIVFSSAFRRLQDKTQVHPLTTSDYIRTRLTHSLEVASVGRSLGSYVGKALVGRYALTGVSPTDFGTITAAACLAHDIGNPPFGHAGEDAFQAWFKANPTYLAGLSDAERADILAFEGNAQGFRTIAATQNLDNEGGLQLTCATLGAFTKYPRASLLPPGLAEGNVAGKKFGFFDSERVLFEEVAETVGLVRYQGDVPFWARHPLAFLMEAADDICYSIIDFEDGYKLHKLGFFETEAGLMALMPDTQLPRYRDIRDNDKKISFLRAKAIGTLVAAAAEVFLAHEAEILAGRFRCDLLSQIPQHETLRHILTVSRERVYFQQDQASAETAAEEVIGGLLNYFLDDAVPAVLASRGLKGLPPGHPLLSVMRLDPALTFSSDYAFLQLVIDYIAGMTDSFAIELLKRLREPVRV